MFLYNQSSCKNEEAHIQTCPCCSGFGNNSFNDEECICCGDGELYLTKNNWYKSLNGKKEGLF